VLPQGRVVGHAPLLEDRRSGHATVQPIWTSAARESGRDYLHVDSFTTAVRIPATGLRTPDGSASLTKKEEAPRRQLHPPRGREIFSSISSPSGPEIPQV